MQAETVLPGRRLQGVGCLVAFVGMVGLTLTPAMGNYVPISPETAYGLLAVAVALLVVGAALGIVGARRDPSLEASALEEAADRVAQAYASDAPSLPGEAVAFLLMCRRGRPEAVQRAAARLGEARAYMTSVERRFADRDPGRPGSS